jgi:putative tryptophan/tyrosine transport system substrate-binding protein
VIKRREFIAAVADTAAWPLTAGAQQPQRVRRIGVLQVLAPDDPVKEVEEAENA